MLTIIAGSRDCTDITDLYEALDECGWNITEVVSGCARGADRLGEEYAKNNNLGIYRFPADWEAFGKSAGYIRNREMAMFAEACLILWDGESKGTANMIAEATKAGIKLHVYRYNDGV